MEQILLWKEETEEVDGAISEAVQKGLDHFGPTFKNVVFHEFMNVYHLDSKSIVKKPILFNEFLDRVFSVGAFRIKQAIVQEIGTKFAIKIKREDDMITLIQRIRDGSHTK
jgi:hypothetical protein